MKGAHTKEEAFVKYLVAILLALSVAVLSKPVWAEESVPSPPPDASAAGSDFSGEPSPSPLPSPGGDPGPTPASPSGAARLYIDNQNVYENMERSYSQGYVPTVENGKALVVLPLLCEGELRGNTLRAKVGLGESGPFAAMNYEKTAASGLHKVNGGKDTVPGYCVTFPLQLREDRVNGSYPVTIRISAVDGGGGLVQEEFTVYVTVTGGIDPNATPTPEPAPTPVPEEPVVLGPKVLVQSWETASLEEGAADGVVNAGDRMRIKITLRNTSKQEDIENMTVTAASPGEGFALDNGTDTRYIERLEAGGTVSLNWEYRIKPETPAGQYAIPLSYDFAYHKGMTGSGAGSAWINVSQPLELEFALLQMPAEAVISDMVAVNVQAINLSHAKAYNVRAVIEADGLSPSGTAFLGDLEGGTSGEKPLQVTITGLTQSAYSYGQTTGTITYLYEDGDGAEYSETGSFTVNIKSPFSTEGSSEPDDPGQWWAVMAALGAAVIGFCGFYGWQAFKRKRP